MTRLPLVYACAGCSAAGRLAYDIALELQRRGVAEMSCLAGVGAAKPHFLKQLNNREVWVIDGCPIECAVGIFAQQRRNVDVYIQLHDLGVRKSSAAPAEMDFDQMLQAVLRQIDLQKAARSSIRVERCEEAQEQPIALKPAASIALARTAEALTT